MARIFFRQWTGISRAGRGPAGIAPCSRSQTGGPPGSVRFGTGQMRGLTRRCKDRWHRQAMDESFRSPSTRPNEAQERNLPSFNPCTPRPEGPPTQPAARRHQVLELVDPPDHEDRPQAVRASRGRGRGGALPKMHARRLVVAPSVCPRRRKSGLRCPWIGVNRRRRNCSSHSSESRSDGPLIGFDDMWAFQHRPS